MKDFKFTTETGSVYTVQRGFWMKNEGCRDRLLYFRAVDDFAQPVNADEMWVLINAAPWVDYPEVGKRMYLASSGEWALTTRVVSIEDLPPNRCRDCECVLEDGDGMYLPDQDEYVCDPCRTAW